jgi:cytochrome-b5 reductase
MYAFSRSSRLRVAAAGVAAGVAGFAYAAHCKSAPKHGLDPKAWVPLKLTQVTPLTENTAIYRFAFADPEATSGMTVASCLLTKADIGKEKPDGSRGAVLRPYTPVSRPDEQGYLELAVKSYPNGVMSKHIASLKIGDTLDFKGPNLKLPYKANEYSQIGMVAGGTGIAPMLQVIDEILENPEDKTKVSLVFANVSVDDILLKKAIDARESLHPDRLTVHYVVDKAPVFPKFKLAGVGYLTTSILQSTLPPPSESSKIYVCGPPPMYKAICGAKGTKDEPYAQGELSGVLKQLGYSEAQVFKF